MYLMGTKVLKSELQGTVTFFYCLIMDLYLKLAPPLCLLCADLEIRLSRDVHYNLYELVNSNRFINNMVF